MGKPQTMTVGGKLSEELLLRYAAIIEGTDDAIIGKTLGGIITSWNPGAERIFGYRAEEAIGESVLILFPRERVDEEIEILQKVSRGERVSNFETVRKRKDGTLIDVSVTVSPLIDLSGQIVGVSKIVRDITPLKRAEEDLQRRAEEYTLAFNESPLPMWIFDIDSLSFLAVNDEALMAYGYSRDEFLAMTIKDIRPPEDVGSLVANVRQVVSRADQGTWRHRRKDGTIITVEVTSRPIQFNGKEARLVLANDITSRRRAEEALVSAEHRYRDVLDNMMEGCQIIGFDWRYIYVNDVAAAQRRKRKSELVEHSVMEVYPGIERTEMFAALRRCMESRIASAMETALSFDDWTTGWFRLSIEPVEDGVFVLSQDITHEKKDAEELEKYRSHLEELVSARTAALEDVNKELEAFSYSVSHDLRTPLRHIDGFAGLLARKIEGTLDQESRKYLDSIRTACKGMWTLIEDLIDFSRNARMEIAKSKVSARALFDRAIIELEGETRGRKIEWNLGPLPEIEADQRLLYLVVLNLLSNAVKYSSKREDAVITIQHSKGDDEDIFVVRDNGVGFDMKYVDKLFGVFQRLHDDEEFKGTGIGLANVRRIISRHGGRTWAEGKVGEGASFYFSIPSATGY